MATFYSLVCENGSAGTYWSGLTATQKLRYGPAGSERVYPSITGFRDALLASLVDFAAAEVCEIAEAFTDSFASRLSFSGVLRGLILITPSVNGVTTSAYHGGVPGGGYVLNVLNNGDGGYNSTTIYMPKLGIIEGIDIFVEDGGYNRGGVSGYSRSLVDRCIIRKSGTPDVTNSAGYVNSSFAILANSLIYGFGTGLSFNRYSPGRVVNSTIVKNYRGASFQYDANTINDGIYNTIIAGNITTNWSTYQPTGLEAALNNAGESTDGFICDTGVNTAIVIDPATAFVNFANDNFRLSTGSLLIDGGFEYYGKAFAVDIANNPRPNYDPTGSELFDVGCYEYDHGNGLAPTTVTVEINGMIEGSVMAIYNSSTNAEIVAPTTIDATGTYTDSRFVYTADVPVNVVVRKATSPIKYLPYNAMGTIGSNGLSITVSQVEDTVA